jgi:hypothetical protein
LPRDFSSKEIEGAWLEEINPAATRSMLAPPKSSSGLTPENRSPSVVPVGPAKSTAKDSPQRQRAEMNHAADEYDEARPVIGDDFLSAVENAFSIIFAAPQRWPFVDARHHRFVLKRWPFSQGKPLLRAAAPRFAVALTCDP